MSKKLYPIVYVRGYAGSQNEVEDTVADPYMGFNVGSTKLRQSWDGSIAKHIFESPLVRLMKDYGYTDAYLDGSEVSGEIPIGHQSIWIYRYYEPVSESLGTGNRPEMETYARGLGEYLKQVRTAVCRKSKKDRADFKVNLVAHSMGGLVVRSWLQNFRFEESDSVDVDKVFTYATPHGGIELRGIGNVPRLFRVNNTENFNRDVMREYLDIPESRPVNSLNGKFPESRFFSLIGTNCKDYAVAGGVASKVVGSFSDGLVKIKNAYVDGSPRAYVHRAHSGHYGIVNSEEGYQNLKRFLFGDVCVVGNLKIDNIALPKKIAQAERKGKKIRAAYHLEVVTKVRDARWDLYRRTTDDASAIYLEHNQLKTGKAEVKLFSSYLSKDAIMPVRKNKNKEHEMGFAIDISLRSPEFVVDKKLFFDDYYEGGYLFRDQLKLKVEMKPGECIVSYQWSSGDESDWSKVVHLGPFDNEWLIEVPCIKETKPGMHGTLELLIEPHGR